MLLMRGLAFTLRLLLMACAIISLFMGYLQGIGLYAAILGAMCSVVAGLLLAKTKMHTRALVAITIFSLLGTWGLGFSIGYLSVYAEVIGISNAISLQLIVYGFGFVFWLATIVRTLAIRHNTMYFIEFWLLALSAAAAFAPHRNHIVLQPLWLSDWAWRNGLEPTLVLGLVGLFLALLLGMVTLLEKTKRIPVIVLFLPLLSFLAFLFIDPTALNEEEPPSQGNDLLESMGGNNKSEQGGGGKGNSDPKQESARKPSEGDGGGEAKPVAVVILETDFAPESGYFYLRQEGLSSFTGKRLNASRDRNIPYDGIVGFPAQTTTVQEIPPDEFRLSIKGHVALLAPHTAPFGVESITYYEPTKNPRPAMFNRTYDFESSAQNISYEELIAFNMGDEEWSDQLWEHYTKGPSNPQYKELAEEIIATLPEEWQENPFAKALAIKLWLDEKTRYTKKVRHAEATDPTAEFLFGPTNQYIGYCVHTSHAAVFLWRAIGIPARVGVGYAIDMQNAKTDGFVVYDGDAHAWPELYFEGVGWIALDIAPAENLDDNGNPPDPALQDSLMELAKADEDSQFREPIDWAALWAQWKWPLFFAVIGGILSVVGAHFGIKLYRRFRPIWAPHPRFVYIAAIDFLSENGIRRERGETPERFARRVQSPSFEAITNAHIAATLGGKKDCPPPEKLSDMGQELSNLSFFRRLVGILNPFSFYLSR